MKVQASLPLGWAQLSLGELHRDDSKGINPADFRDETFELYSVPSHANRVPEFVQGSAVGSNKIAVTPETLLLCKINPRINRVWVTGSFSPHRKIASTEWIPFAPINGMCMAYLALFMQQNPFRDFLAAHASGVGGSLMRVRPATFRDYVVPLPPLPEQRRIVAKIEELFTRLDAGVAALQAVKQQIKRYRQAVLRDAFTGKLTEEWRERELRKPDSPLNKEPAAKLLERILRDRQRSWSGPSQQRNLAPAEALVDLSDTRNTQRLWLNVRAEAISDFITKGTTPDRRMLTGRSGVPFIKVYNLTFDLALDFTVNPTFTDLGTHGGVLARSKAIPGDVLMNIVGPPLGKVSIVPETFPESNINQAIVRYRPIPGYSGKFLAYMLMSDPVQAWAKSRAKATAGQFNLTLEICRDLPLPLPALHEQEQVVLEIDRHFSLADFAEKAVDESLAKADHLRQSILKQAFEGKLVPQDPTDEPAEKLLERVRARRTDSDGQRRTTPRRRQSGDNAGPRATTSVTPDPVPPVADQGRPHRQLGLF